MPKKYIPNDYRIEGEIAYMAITNRAGEVRAEAIVDAALISWLSRWRWSLASTGYVVCSRVIDGRNVQTLLHRLIVDAAKGDGTEVDHRNRNRLDNRRANLNHTTTAINNKNRANPPTSRFTGVSWCKRTERWQAHIYRNSKTVALGRFDSEHEAVQAVAQYQPTQN